MRLRLSLVMVVAAAVTVPVGVVAVSGQVPAVTLFYAWALGMLCALVPTLRLLRRLQAPLDRLLEIGLSLKQGAVGPRQAGAHTDLGGDALVAAYSEIARSVRRKLREAEERRQETDTIFVRMADGIIVVDADLRIRQVNPAASELLGISGERAVGMTIIEATVHHALDGLFHDAIAAGRTRARRLETIQPRRRVIQALVTPLEAGAANEGGAVAVLQDLTELDRLERVRRDFVTNVSHELRTPVTSIKVMVESLQRGAAAQPALRDEFLKSIADAADRLARLVGDVLALARVEAGPASTQWQPVAVGKLAEEIVGGLQPLAAEHGVRLHLDSAAGVTIQGDAEGIRQALINLVNNAIKYNQPGGEVRVRVDRAPDGALIEVSDTGIGIPLEHQSRIFERFYRVDRGRSRELGGTGLGLAIVKHVAEVHGGRVVVASEPGRGSVFTLTVGDGSRSHAPAAAADR